MCIRDSTNIGTSSPYIFTKGFIDFLDPANIGRNGFCIQDGIQRSIDKGVKVGVDILQGVYLTNGDPVNNVRATLLHALNNEKYKEEVLNMLANITQ